MYDLQAIKLQDVVSVRSVLEISSSPTRLFQIRGVDFRSTVEVYLNDIPVTDFIVESRELLIAEGPAALGTADVGTVLVVNSSFTLTDTSLVKFSLGRTKTTGLMRLMQLFVKILLTTPGSDIHSPEIGGGLRQFVGMVVSDDNSSDITGLFLRAVARTRSQILSMQAQNAGIPADERLASARVVSVTFDKESSTLQGRVTLTSLAGKSALMNLAA